MSKGSNTVKRPRHMTVEKNGKFDESGVPRGASPSGADMDDDGATIKMGREYRWIGLVEVIYNICASIVNNRLCSTITLYDALNGFRNGRGTGQQP